MATTKVERAGVGFGIGRQGGSAVLEVRPHHKLLNGITPEQAKKILDV